MENYIAAFHTVLAELHALGFDADRVFTWAYCDDILYRRNRKQLVAALPVLVYALADEHPSESGIGCQATGQRLRECQPNLDFYTRVPRVFGGLHSEQAGCCFAEHGTDFVPGSLDIDPPQLRRWPGNNDQRRFEIAVTGSFSGGKCLFDRLLSNFSGFQPDTALCNAIACPPGTSQK